MSERDAVEDFLRQLATVRRLSENTVAAYRRDLESLLDFMEREGIAGVAELDAWHIRRFAAEYFRQGLSPRSIARRLSAVRSYLGALVREGVLEANVNLANERASVRFLFEDVEEVVAKQPDSGADTLKLLSCPAELAP